MQILKNIWNKWFLKSNKNFLNYLRMKGWKEIFYEKYYEKLIDYISSW